MSAGAAALDEIRGSTNDCVAGNRRIADAARCPGARKELHRADGAGGRCADDPAHARLLQVDRGEPVPGDPGRRFGLVVVGEQLVGGQRLDDVPTPAACRSVGSGRVGRGACLPELPGANDPFDVRPDVVADGGDHGFVEIGMRRQVAIQQLLTLSDAADPHQLLPLDRGQFCGEFGRAEVAPDARRAHRRRGDRCCRCSRSSLRWYAVAVAVVGRAAIRPDPSSCIACAPAVDHDAPTDPQQWIWAPAVHRDLRSPHECGTRIAQAAGQAEHPLAEDVAHHVRRAAHDRVAGRVGQALGDLDPTAWPAAPSVRATNSATRISCSVQKHFVAALNPAGACRSTSRITRSRPMR